MGKDINFTKEELFERTVTPLEWFDIAKTLPEYKQLIVLVYWDGLKLNTLATTFESRQRQDKFWIGLNGLEWYYPEDAIPNQDVKKETIVEIKLGSGFNCPYCKRKIPAMLLPELWVNDDWEEYRTNKCKNILRWAFIPEYKI